MFIDRASRIGRALTALRSTAPRSCVRAAPDAMRDRPAPSSPRPRTGAACRRFAIVTGAAPIASPFGMTPGFPAACGGSR
ncbi:hypothetical protein WG70_19685 [Burkholderia oklahomensis EO147]|nr:hypothetical protein WG70_19685 [Burkholderia oklahomensis EO147]KUY49688.1 hypothetical protein WG70_18705 [Burkholderia oklahomensis EO147]